MARLFLASASPRRKELLRSIFSEFEIFASVVDESVEANEKPADYVERTALKKIDGFFAQFTGLLAKGDLVISADTTVSLAGKILGKPLDYADAENMLNSLSGRSHEVITGVALARYLGGPLGDKNSGYRTHVFHVSTQVKFRVLEKLEIEAYLSSNEPWDKAGAYGVQGEAGKFVSEINGNYQNIVGLPLAQLYEEIKKI